jgi:uncharacterized protein YbjT (DUF2867 family)
MILITGASGTNGREIVKQLSAKGLQFRAMVRQLPAPVLQLPNVEYVVGDFTDLSSIRLALAGIDEAFLLSSSTAGQVERETNFMRMASEANVRHLVKFSILGADPDSPSTLLRRHGEIEQTLRHSGVPFTILRPSYFMQNLFWYAKDIRSKGVFYGVWPKDYRHAHVDARDNAGVAVACLTQRGHEGKCYRITGPEALSYREIAELLSTAIGTNVRYENSLEDYRCFLESSGSNVEEIIGLDQCVAEGIGAGGMVNATVSDVAGREPLRFAQFARDYSGAFRHDYAPT